MDLFIEEPKQAEKIPAFLNKRIFQRFFKIAEVANLTNEERVMYNASLKAKMDYEGSIAFAEENAFEKGEHKKALEIARNLKNMGIPLEVIAESTGLIIKEIEAL